MNKFNHILRSFKKNSSKIVSPLLLSIIVTGSFSYLSNNRAIARSAPLSVIAELQPRKQLAQEKSQSEWQKSDSEEKSEPISASRSRDRSSILEAIWKLLRAKREQEPALSSRSNICEITPGLLGEVNVIYSDRPLFLWQGKVPSLEIYLYTPFSLEREQEILWSQTVGSDVQKVLYTGKALEVGQIYDWEIVVNPQSNRRRISFQVMAGEKRDRIRSELEQLETELTISGATASEITLARANYFAQQDLWSDALQELFSLENSATTLSSNAIEIVEYLCESGGTEIRGNLSQE